MAYRPAPPPEAARIIRKDWSYLESLDTRGWRDELRRLEGLFDPPLSAKEWSEWGAILEGKEGGPNFIGPLLPPNREWRHVGIGPPPTVQLLERPRNGERQHRVHAIETPSLLVQLNAPDAVIFSQFEAALAKARKLYPAPVQRPGRKALNARFGPRKFNSWSRNKIIPLGELLAWRADLREDEQQKYSRAALGVWLGFDECGTSRAMGCLRKAITSIPALWAQAVEEPLKKKNITPAKKI